MERQKTLAQSVFSFLGGVSGLISIGLIVWKGGILWSVVETHTEKLATHERRFESIESSGSMGLREHVKLDDVRVAELQAEQKNQREVSNKVIELVGEVKLVNFKLDELKAQIMRGNPKSP